MAIAWLFGSTSVWAISVAPSPSSDGNYTVSWSTETGCIYEEPWPGWTTFECWTLQEKAGSSSWHSVSTPDEATSWAATDKPEGTYSYQIHYSYGDINGADSYVWDGPVSVLVDVPSPPPPTTTGFDSKYVALQGDFNSDGLKDIYLERPPELVFVDVGDILTPIVTSQREVGRFLLQQTQGGNFELRTDLTEADWQAVSQWQESGIEISVGDVNADGVHDVMLGELAAALQPNVDDVIVYGPPQAGDAPQVARAMDPSLIQFFADVSGWFEDPAYFSAGYRRACSVILREYYSYVPPWDGLYNAPIYIPRLICVDYYDPSGFHPGSAEFVGLLQQAILDGEIVSGSAEAIQIADILEQVLGIELLNGVLRNGGTADIDAFFPPSSLNFEPGEDIFNTGQQRLFRLLRMMVLIEWLSDDPDEPGVQHSYELDSGICTVGAPGCTLENVFLEMRYHPASGFVTNTDPIDDGDQSAVDIAMPDFIPILGAADNGGPLVFVVNESQYTIENHTLDGHRFHGGSVVREAYIDQETNQIRIHTVGSGTGANPRLNEEVGRELFNQVDALISCHITQNPNCAALHGDLY